MGDLKRLLTDEKYQKEQIMLRKLLLNNYENNIIKIQKEKAFLELKIICADKKVEQYKDLPIFQLNIMRDIILTGKIDDIEKAYELSKFGEVAVKILKLL